MTNPGASSRQNQDNIDETQRNVVGGSLGISYFNSTRYLKNRSTYLPKRKRRSII